MRETNFVTPLISEHLPGRCLCGRAGLDAVSYGAASIAAMQHQQNMVGVTSHLLNFNNFTPHQQHIADHCDHLTLPHFRDEAE